MKALRIGAWLLVAALGAACRGAEPAADLEKGFAQPPDAAKLRVYWWWLNGNVTKAAITRDLEEMKAKGIGGALIFDAGGPAGPTPSGPAYMSREWRELFKHAVREADRLGLELSLSIQSGWNLGGPIVKPEEAAKKVVWSEMPLTGPRKFAAPLPAPKSSGGFYRDIAVVAYRLPAAAQAPHKPLRLWEMKCVHHEFGGSAPDTSPLLADDPDQPGEEDTHAKDVADLTAKLAADGTLAWDVPEGAWQVIRVGYTYSGAKVSTSSPGWAGMGLDYLDSDALRSYWRQAVAPLIADAGPLAGKALKYLHTDSWELGGMNWTAGFADEFLKRRGYDLRPYLPVLAGRIVDSRSVSNRFLNDFRKTIGDCIADNHYRLFSQMAHEHGMGIHPESGGPHGAPVDALKCLGRSDVSMMEFWARAKTHRVRDEDRLFVKQAASAAHIYGKTLVTAEAFTTIAPHWQETLWDNLKPTFDQEACEGLNRCTVHQFTCSPAEAGVPGQEYFAGTHFNPQVTWWSKAGAFTACLNRCQFLLQQGLFVADACYFYGDQVPNFVQFKKTDPAHVLPGYDYDACNVEVLTTRAKVVDGRIVLPDGMSYRVLVLPDRAAMPVGLLRKLREFVEAGATVIGPPPREDTGLRDYPRCDDEVKKLAADLWGTGSTAPVAGDTAPAAGGTAPGTGGTAQGTGGTAPVAGGTAPVAGGTAATQHTLGKGRVIWGKTAREVLAADGVPPDFEYTGGGEEAFIDYIHRRAGDAEIYFVANRQGAWTKDLVCTFRTSGKVPELWDPLTGEVRPAAAWKQAAGRTTLPLEFAPFGSIFVIFRKPCAADAGGAASRNSPQLVAAHEIGGPWTVKFDPKWGGPAEVEFKQLANWAERPEDGIRHYAGTATYVKQFDLPQELRTPGRRLVLDLGNVKQLAEVRLNGRTLGVLWAMPFRVDVTDAIRPTGNSLEIEVTNFWPNRLIGDAALPEEKRFTHTTVRTYKADAPLMDSGLLGPVRILAEEKGATAAGGM